MYALYYKFIFIFKFYNTIINKYKHINLCLLHQFINTIYAIDTKVSNNKYNIVLNLKVAICPN